MNEMGLSLRSGAFPLRPVPGWNRSRSWTSGTGPGISLSVVEFASSCLLAKTSKFMYRKVYHSSKSLLLTTRIYIFQISKIRVLERRYSGSVYTLDNTATSGTPRTTCVSGKRPWVQFPALRLNHFRKLMVKWSGSFQRLPDLHPWMWSS